MSTIVYSEQFTKALPSQVYYALTHAGALTEWLCDFATVAPRPGGRMYLWWHGDFYSAGEYIELVENTSIRFKWFGRGDPAATEVLVTLEKKRGGTQVRFAHAVPDGRKWHSPGLTGTFIRRSATVPVLIASAIRSFVTPRLRPL